MNPRILLFLLFINLLVIISSNREVAKLVRVTGCCNNAKVITQLLLFQVSLGKVLELSLGELNFSGCRNSELGTITRDGNSRACKCSSISVNLDMFLEVLLEGSNIKYLIVDRSGTVDDVFYDSLLCLNLK